MIKNNFGEQILKKLRDKSKISQLKLLNTVDKVTRQFSYMNDIANFADDDTRITSLKIKRKYQPLSTAENQELLYLMRARDRKERDDTAETGRNTRFLLGEGGKLLGRLTV